MSADARPLGYWVIQGFFLLSIPLMLAGQTLSLFDYELAVALGMQESGDLVGDFGVQMNKAFAFADTVVYLPLFAASIIGLWRRATWSLVVAGATFGVSLYWSVTIAAAFELLPAAPGYVYVPPFPINAFVTTYAVAGLAGLAYLVLRGEALVRPHGGA